MTAALAEYTGTLLHSAQVRAAVLDGEGHSVPVLCFDMELDNALRTHMHVQKTFPFGHQSQATAEARGLKKGIHVTVPAPLVGMRLVATNVSHIQILNPTEPPEPCQQSRLL